VNWTIAHRVAAIAAANLRGRLGVPEDGYVDVFAALRRCGLTVVGQDMPSLFGAYLPPRPGRYGGIFLNSTMGETTIRHTAAHELGHAEHGHEQCLADGLDPFSTTSPQKWPDEEKQAEAFAAWFLMPIRAVKVALTRLGLDVPREAMDVYQLSLHLGTSYRGTLRHLQNLRMVKPDVARGWAGVQPARLRARLSGPAGPTPARIWVLPSLTDGCTLPVEQGDRLIVRTPCPGDNPAFAGPESVVMRDEARAVWGGDGIEFDVVGCIDSSSSLTVISGNGQRLWSGVLLPTPVEHRGLIASGHAPVLVGSRSRVR
jgi:hypothetical protein